jgi:hypothetical protein
MKAIIFLANISRYAPAKQGAFLWSEKHQCHIWDGRELDAAEFNQVADAVLRAEDYFIRPSVRLLLPAAPEGTPAPRGSKRKSDSL